MAIELMDSDGENRAVRSFLLLYGTNAKTTVGCMLSHLRLSGFPYWPDWVNTEHPCEHLTKAGAQLWIRHLLTLEPGKASLADAQAEIARLRGALDYVEECLSSAKGSSALDDKMIDRALNGVRQAKP